MKKPQASEERDIRGIIVAAVTPRREHEYSIDLAATLELVDFVGESGANGILLLGSTGEFVHFALDDRRHMVNFAARRSRVPLLVNVSHTTLDGAIDLARDAAEDGAAGVLIMPPYFFRYGQDDLRAFFLAFAKGVEEAVPIYLYNIPSFTNPLDASTAAELLSTGLFAGIKDSSGSIEYFAEVEREHQRTPFKLFVGSESVYVRARQGGADGMISGIASAIPELYVAMHRELAAGNLDRVRCLEARSEQFLEHMREFSFPVIIKEAARLRKLKVGALAVPLDAEAGRKLGEFGDWFLGWWPEVLRECGG